MKKKKLTQEEQIQFEVGSKNVFADLGFENPDEMLFKADLTAEITRIIKKRKFTQSKAAKIIGVDQPRISCLLRGRLDLFSIEMLMQFLNALGQDIEVSIKPSKQKKPRLSVTSSSKICIPMAAKSRGS